MPGLSRRDALIELKIDPRFTGILRGQTDDVSEGCVLKGNCVLHVHRTLRVNKLSVIFEGQCEVSIKAAPLMGKPALEGAERCTLIQRAISLKQHNSKPPDEFQPGDYTYPFRFDLPSTLPASFQGKRGHIWYSLEAVVLRASSSLVGVVINKNIRRRHDICLRRCLLAESILSTPLLETVHGQDHPDKITYSATAPMIMHREGGLVPLNLTLQLSHPDTQRVQSVTCALRERIVYRTTGQQSMTCQTIANTDDHFPLGWSTFYPSKEKDYDPHHKHEYNAEFRLCPRINADSVTQLLEISHTLVVNIVLEDMTDSLVEGDGGNGNSNSNVSNPSPLSPPLLPFRRSSSSSSLEDFVKEAASTISFTIKRRRRGSSSSNSSYMESPKAITTEACRQQLQLKNMYVCSLECPIVVTSRERYWEGDYPNPPAYQAAGDPPTYHQALGQLPSAPAYD